MLTWATSRRHPYGQALARLLLEPCRMRGSLASVAQRQLGSPGLPAPACLSTAGTWPASQPFSVSSYVPERTFTARTAAAGLHAVCLPLPHADLPGTSRAEPPASRSGRKGLLGVHPHVPDVAHGKLAGWGGHAATAMAATALRRLPTIRARRPCAADMPGLP